MQMFNELPKGPPPGFRKAIPTLLKLKVVLRQNSKCATCGEPLGKLDLTEFDHVPAIQLRTWDEEARDTIPPSNDESCIFAKHDNCHDAKTFGTKASKRGADVTEIARTKRIAKDTENFRRKILAKNDPDADPEAQQERKPKKQWPKRPFPSRRRDEGSRSRSEEGS